MFKCHNMSRRAFVSQYTGRDPVILLLVLLHSKNYKRSNRIVMCLRVTTYWAWIGNRISEHLQNVITNKDYALTVLYTSQITVTTVHIHSSQFAKSLQVVAW
jgi:hypothetical protein